MREATSVLPEEKEKENETIPEGNTDSPMNSIGQWKGMITIELTSHSSALLLIVIHCQHVSRL
jgi:hypothetical protein